MGFKLWVILDGSNLQKHQAACGDLVRPHLQAAAAALAIRTGSFCPLPFPKSRDAEDTAAWLGRRAASHPTPQSCLALLAGTVDVPLATVHSLAVLRT